MKEKIAVFPGSFDPITKGHASIVERALPLFDRIIVAIGKNAEKQYMFSLEKRKEWLENVFKGESKVQVRDYEGLTVDFCAINHAQYLLRGLRSTSDFEFEKNIAQVNRNLRPEIETVFLVSSPELSAIKSSIVRDILKNGGNASNLLPPAIQIH